MKTLLILILGVFMSQVQATSIRLDNEQIIDRVITKYVDGYLNAESELVKEAFHPDTVLYSSDNGELDKTTMKEWLKNLDERKASGDIRKAQLEIHDVEVTGDMARAKITITFAKKVFTDYLLFLRLANKGWTIIGKTYSVKELKRRASH